MKLSKFTVILAVLLMAILAIGAVSAESVDIDDSVSQGVEMDDMQISEDLAPEITSVEPTEDDPVDDTGVAVENNLGDDGTDENPSYDLSDDTYSTYFNDDGTPKEILVPAGDEPAGDYNLVVGTLNNKDIIIDYGSQIKIIAKEGEGTINNGTIIIGDGYGNAGSVFISGLTFNNYNKGGVIVNEGSTDIQIDNNEFNLDFDSTYEGSAMAIVTYGFVSGVSITDNEINMDTDVTYSYGIDLMSYTSMDPPIRGAAGAEDFYVAGNLINIVSNAEEGMAEGMYLDSLAGSVFENNVIKVSTVGVCANYGIQLADSWGFMDFEDYAPSPYDVKIIGNDISLISTDIAYGLSTISLFSWGPDMGVDIVKDMVISDNTVTILSEKRGIGIATKGSDVEITNNSIFLLAADDEADIGAYSDPTFGNKSAGILIVSFDTDLGMGDYDYSNITIKGNSITTNVEPIKVTKNETGNQPLVVEDNAKNDIIYIDDESFSTYFDENGAIKDDAPISENDALILGELNNKKFVIDIPLVIKGLGDRQVNTTISLVEGADGSSIDGLYLYFDGNSASTGIIYLTNVNNVNVTNNVIVATNCNAMMMAIEVESGSEGCSDILIRENNIAVSGNTNYLYGIDVFQTLGKTAKNVNIGIADNLVDINGGAKMAEAIYVSAAENVGISGNDITAISTGCAYGIATDSLINAEITDNIINANATTTGMAYAITSTNSNDVEITDNQITAEGTGVVGIGLLGDDTVTIDNNSGSLKGKNFVTAQTRDSLGVANAPILNKGSSSSNVTVGDNSIILRGSKFIDDSTYDQYFDEEGNIIGSLFTEIEGIVCGNLTNKDMKIDIVLMDGIQGIPGSKLINSTISLLEGADEITIAGLTIEFSGNNPTGIIYVKDVRTFDMYENNITITDCNSTMMAIQIESSSENCGMIHINHNNIEINGTSNYIYGIDAYSAYWVSQDATIDILSISDNVVTINGGAKMAEPIYVSKASDVEIMNNNLTALSTGCAYGIATDSLEGSYIAGNIININATTDGMAYAIASTNSNGVVVSDNNIVAEGTGVVGIGFKNDDDISINGNTINVTGGYYETAQTRDMLGVANAAILNKDDNNTNVDIGENTIIENFPAEAIVIDESNYDQYFDENGNIIDGTIPENANVVFGDLTGKNMVINIPLLINAVENTQLVNSTISLVAGADGTVIRGLDMYYEDNGSAIFAIISVNNGVSNVVIDDNTITTVSAPSWNYNMAISVYGATVGSENITISGNTITMTGDAGGLYGIDAQNYDPYWAKGQGVTGLNISDNVISIEGSGMVEPIYVSSCNDILIDGNKITSSSNGGDAYGVGTSANNNFTLTNNEIEVLSENNMAYGIASPDSTDVVIDNNNFTVTGVGAIGIGFINDENVEIDGNIINITGSDYTTVSTHEKVGTGNAAILDKSDNTGVVIGENTIIENCPLTIDDSNYATYFNNDGTIKDDAPISPNDLIFIGKLNNKKFIIDTPLTIKGTGDKQVNTTISLVTGADGTLISGLDMDYTDDGSATFAVISVNNGVSNVVIADNTLNVVTAPSWNYNMAISVYGATVGSENITISGNTITMTGDAGGLYGIDAQNYDPYWAKGQGVTGLNISDNVISIEGSGMVEPIYVSTCNDILIDGNIITSSSTGGDAYGIGTDSNNNINFTNNQIDVASENNMAYGITSTNSDDVVFNDNTISSTGVGAVGIGVGYDNNVAIDGNSISIEGGDYTPIDTSDVLGLANAAILNKKDTTTDLVIGENTLTENGEETDRIGVGTGADELQKIIDNAEEGSTIDLGDDVFYKVSDVVVNKDLTITGGTIVGKAGSDIFVVDSTIDEFTLSDSTIRVNNANTVVKVIAENATSPTAIDVPAVTVKDNTIELANDDVVPESVTVMELESERGILAPNNELTVSGNTLPAGVDPFEFTITSISEGGNTNIPAGGNIGEKLATVIEYEDMNTTAIDSSIEPGTGKYFEITLRDSNGVALANKPVQFGFNGKIYNKTTDENGIAKLQINLQRSDIYTFAVSFQGDDAYNGSFAVAKITVKKQTPTLTVPNKSYKASAKTKTLTATFKSASGKVVANKKVTFTVNGKTYTATTNDKGVASVNVSLSTKKTYSFTAKFAGDNTYAAITKTAKLTIN